MTDKQQCSGVRAVTRTVGRARHGTLHLWTIQPLWVWERLCEQKSLYSDPTQQEHFPVFRNDYDWMRVQMRRRLPGYSGHYPWWAYEHKPDLRHQNTCGSELHVRLELAVPLERVLLSAYGAWHFVLNPSYLPHSADDAGFERESDAWDAELEQHGIDPYRRRPLPEPWHSRMTASWERIFDVDELRDTNTIQACFERLDLVDVVKVTTFMPRYRCEQSGVQ